MSISDEEIAIIKGMLLRGDKNQSIVACFGGEHNPGRIAEISNAMARDYADDEPALTTRARSIEAAPDDALPPPPPYPTPYDLWRAGRSVRQAQMVLERTKDKIQIALSEIETAGLGS